MTRLSQRDRNWIWLCLSTFKHNMTKLTEMDHNVALGASSKEFVNNKLKYV